MSTVIELWKNWEGRVVDGRFRLRQWLGASDHSAVFFTERIGAGPQTVVIKLIRTDEDAQPSGAAAAAKLSHPNLIRLFEDGRCQIDGTRLRYVVMEYAEENLAEILALRQLSPAEASEMLEPMVEVLTYLHQSGFAHGHIKPSNIMAINNRLKLSADGLGKTGERGHGRAFSAYDAPELPSSGLSPAADIWSLGITLVAVLTQNHLKNGDRGRVAVAETIPQPFREIARQCLQVDPKERCTAANILSQLQTRAFPTKAPVGAKLGEAPGPQLHMKRWIAVPIVAVGLFLIVWAGRKFMVHPPAIPAPAIPAAETRPASPPVEPPATQSRAPLSENTKPAPQGVTPGSVLEQVLPDVSRSAKNTIEGHVRVSVQVSVDASGNVSQAKLLSPGPSKYFADRALAAARRWKFAPPQVDGQAVASAWVLRFQFGRTDTQMFPSETKP
jgi:TonB family protein